MKKLLILALLAVLALAAACSDDDDAAASLIGTWEGNSDENNIISLSFAASTFEQFYLDATTRVKQSGAKGPYVCAGDKIVLTLQYEWVTNDTWAPDPDPDILGLTYSLSGNMLRLSQGTNGMTLTRK